jgi:hypothetical protein
MRRIYLAALGPALSVLALSVAVAAESEFLSRFDGSFSGGGLVQRDAGEIPSKVSCRLTGEASETVLSMSGRCRAHIFSKRLKAEISFDPSSGRYSGVYVGSSIGPAGLYGRRKGDAVVLTITWPKPVNGDTEATMTIRNSGDGRLTITVTDEIAPGGPAENVTQLALQQS